MDIYQDIASRTGGEIYIGVVGPVRTGKSTFIKRFMDLCVIPYMEEGHSKLRTIDELPVSAQGKTIMTTEPKFIPQNGANIRIDENREVQVRLVDCVGYVVKDATGYMEGEEKRMVKTPWFTEEIPFEEAAKLGTLKVIKEHATIGVVVTCDGSFGELQRNSYLEAEEETIKEMEATGKPYVIVLNSERPYGEDTENLRQELELKYHRPVVALNCKQMQKSDVVRILENVLLEFPVSQIEFYIPKWTEMLPLEHEMKQDLVDFAKDFLSRMHKMKDLYEVDALQVAEGAKAKPVLRSIRTSDGTVELRMEMEDSYYFDYVSALTGMEIGSEYELVESLKSLSLMKQEYERVSDALDSVEARGYGVVTPGLSDIVMEEPVLINHAGKYGVKIRANSPSVHMIRANIETEIAPIVGSKEQAEDLIAYIKEGEYGTEGVWGANIFGKSLGELMEDGIRDKINRMDEECQSGLQNTMQKIVNENNGGLVCIII